MFHHTLRKWAETVLFIQPLLSSRPYFAFAILAKGTWLPHKCHLFHCSPKWHVTFLGRNLLWAELSSLQVCFAAYSFSNHNVHIDMMSDFGYCEPISLGTVEVSGTWTGSRDIYYIRVKASENWARPGHVQLNHWMACRKPHEPSLRHVPCIETTSIFVFSSAHSLPPCTAMKLRHDNSRWSWGQSTYSQVVVNHLRLYFHHKNQAEARAEFKDKHNTE